MFQLLSTFLVLLLSWHTVAAEHVEADQSTDQQKQVHATLNAFHQAAAEADFKAYFEQLTPHAIFLGSDATERWPVEDFKLYVRPYFEKGQGWTYLPRERNIVIEGTTAWFDELLDSESYGECRGTGVLVKRKGRWRIAQYNLHFPIPNELAKEITTRITRHQNSK